ERGTRIRVQAAQASPLLISRPPPSTPGATAARSASSSTTTGDRPPSSRWNRVTFSQHSLAIRLPPEVPPVKDTWSTSGLLIIPSATLRGATTRLSAPGGRPASAKASTSTNALSGVSDAGLSTTVHPAINAGSTLLSVSGIGEFHGTIAETTPTGSCTIFARAPSGEVRISGSGGARLAL